MTTEATTTALLRAIERRLTDISEQQHALAVEKDRLQEQLTPLRLGMTLRGLTAAWSAARRPRPPILKAVAAIRPAGAPRPLTGSEIGHRGDTRGGGPDAG